VAAFSDIATLQFQAHLADGQAIRNTLHFRRNPTAGSVDATWLTAWVADSNTTTLMTKYKAILRSTDRLDGVLGRATRDPSNPTADRDEAFRTDDQPGTRVVAGNVSPDELTGILKLSGDLAGRRYRGRIWLPPPMNQTDVQGENYYDAGAYGLAVDAFVTELNKTLYTSGAGHYGGSWNDVDMVVFSRVGRLAGGTYYSRVSSISKPRKFHWLRSRNPTSA
jgi:hypothetical protein